MSETEFLKSVDAGEFLEYEWVHNAAYYGTKKKDVEQGIQAGKIVLSEIDTKGLKQVLEKHPNFNERYDAF